MSARELVAAVGFVAWAVTIALLVGGYIHGPY